MTRVVKQDNGPEIRRVTWVGMLVNVGLSVVKFIAGMLGHSQALVADAVHSTSDLVTDVAIIIGSKFWNSPPDSSHPNGHRRFETLVSLGIGLAVMGVGVFIALEAVDSLQTKNSQSPEMIAAVVALLSVISKEILFRYTRRKGRLLRSQALEANAWHHRSDAFSSIPVVIAVLLAILFPSLTFIDSLGAILVSLLILKSGFDIVRPCVHQIADGAPDGPISEKLESLAAAVPGVLSIHNFRVRYLGNDLQVSLHVVVDQNMTLLEAHNLAEEVEQVLIQSDENVVDAMVHIDPYDPSKLKTLNETASPA